MKKYKHKQAVASTYNGSLYQEFDKHDRVVFERDNHGFWSMQFYTENPLSPTPYEVIHKYYFLYNSMS